MSSSVWSQISFLTLVCTVISSNLWLVECHDSKLSYETLAKLANFTTVIDVQYTSCSFSILIDNAGGSQLEAHCDRVVLKDNVRFKVTAAGRIASFSTSYTFFITAPGSGSISNGSAPGGGLLFEFVVDNIIKSEDPKRNYTRCGGKTSHCSYLVNGGHYTVWFEYDGTEQKIEVRLANGSYPGFSKPAQALVQVSKLDLLTDQLEDFMYVGLRERGGTNPVAHKILSWSFANGGMSEISIPDLADRAGLVAGTCGAIATFLVVCIVLINLKYRMRRRSSAKHGKAILNHLDGPRLFTYKELRKATKDFNENELLGSGGFGDVYKGTLQPSGTVVAVKRRRNRTKHGEDGFLAEASCISQLRHRNLVQLQGWCHEKERMLLVYDFMSNGSLNEWLFESRRVSDERKSCKFDVLHLGLRYRILAGVSAAVEYLHAEWLQCVLHRDIKSSNVMLDADFNAHLGDFGLARLLEHQKVEKTTLMAGTLGYMAPEMPYTGKATKEADIYSFGILVLEVVCGRRPLDMQAVEPEDLVLLNSVWRAHEADKLLNVIDPRLRNRLHDDFRSLEDPRIKCDPLVNNYVNLEADNKMMINLLQLGLRCCLPDPSARPSIQQVNRFLQQPEDFDVAVTTLPPLPATKPLSLYPSFEYSQCK